IAKKPAFFAFGGSPMKIGALTAALLPEFQLLPFSNKPPLIVLKLALWYCFFSEFWLLAPE
ncbi:MAG: hypothetical protein KKD92_14720, partial [Proteobacteria bacterium]|nr:hypothetical protein [Pseudomonadota bacterium]